MILSLIAAIGKNNELGKDNTLLWHLPADLKHFREMTSGHPVIMGRKTFESIGRPLPNRRNVVITRDASYAKDGIEVVHSLDEAIALFKNSRASMDVARHDFAKSETVFVIGGGEIYNQAITVADELDITHVDASLPADTFFPKIDPTLWQQEKIERHEADTENKFPYAFAIYKKLPR